MLDCTGVQKGRPLREGELKVGRSIYLPISLYLRVREEAEREGTSISKVVTDALTLYFFLKENPQARAEFKRFLEALRGLAGKGGSARELEEVVKALAEALSKEREVKSGG
jgi:hypothetical protein